MKKILGFFQRTLIAGSAVFSALTVGYAVLFYIMYADAEERLIDLDRLILFFVFGLLVGLAHALWKLPILPTAVRFLIHLAITLFAYFSCLLLPLGLKGSGYLVGAVVFLLVYFLTFGLYTLLSEKAKRKKEALAEYEKQFGKSK